MSKSKYGHSNLYMSTRDFANLVINTLNDQGSFTDHEVAHPEDIAHAFVTASEAIGSALAWAISEESKTKKTESKKKALVDTGNLRKQALPIDEEIAPTIQEDELGYSEYRHKNAYM